jgi:hypothetical protein
MIKLEFNIGDSIWNDINTRAIVVDRVEEYIDHKDEMKLRY